jgi:hypothetical protein
MRTLFERLLRERFGNLPPSVQSLHLQRGERTYRGFVDVERGSSLLSRFCALATRLPPAGRGPITVHIGPSARGEQWMRRIGGHVMRSRLWDHGGLLNERLGLVTFGFRLDAIEGQLTWTVVRVRALGIPLPARAFRAVRAAESEHDGRYQFEVVAALPFAGPLVRYKGQLDVE